MENDELSPIHKTPELKKNGNVVHYHHGYSGATVASQNSAPASYTMPERIAANSGHDERETRYHEMTPIGNFSNASAAQTLKKQSSSECALEVCKIRNRSNTNFDGPMYGRGPTASGARSTPTTPYQGHDIQTTRESFLRASTSRKQRDRASATPTIPQLDRSPGRITDSRQSPSAATEVQEKTSIGPRGQTLTTISKREDDDCSGGIVRWMEKCVHNKRPLTWGGSRWSEPGGHDYTPSCGGGGRYGANSYQVQAPAPRGPKCNGCDKKYCYYPGMNSQQAPSQNETMQNMPFMYPPNCPEDTQQPSGTGRQPSRCNSHYGQPIPLAAHKQNYGNRFANPSEGIHPPAKPCNPKNPSNMNISLVSHISGFEPPITQPLNSHYVGYSQKYPQDVIKSKNI